MVDFSGPTLGDVEVEVRANLDKLLRGFAQAKGQTASFNADMAKVTQATKAAFDETNNLEQEYRALARAYDPLRAAATKYGDALVRIQRLQAGGMLSKGTAQQWAGAARAEFDKTAAGLAAVGAAAGKAEHGVKKAGHEAGIAAESWKLFTGLVGVATVEQLGDFVYKQLEATAAIKDLSKEVGLSTKELQEYRLAGTAVGITAQDMDSAFKQFNETITDASAGLDRPKKLFDLLKISLVDAGGQTKPTGQLFLELMDKIGQVGNTAQQKAALMLAFGDTVGPKLVSMLELGSDGIKKLRDQFADSIMDEQQIEDAERAKNTLALLKAELTQNIQSEIAANSQAIIDFANSLVTLGENAIWALGKFREFLAGISGGNISIPGALARMSGQYLATEGRGLNSAGTTVSGVSLSEGGTAIAKAKEMGLKLADPKKGGGIDLSGLLDRRTGRHKGGGKGHKVENQFDREELRQQQEALRLRREQTSSLTEQNDIDKQLIDIRVRERAEQLDQMVHRKALTAKQAETLKQEDAANALIEKEIADRKLRVDLIEQSYQYSNEMLNLEQEGLDIELRLARNNEERRKLELLILSSKQQQARNEIEKSIEIAKEVGDQQRVTELVEERRKLIENQNAEIKAFDVEHLTGFAKFKHDLPQTVDDINEAIDNIRLDRFLEKLQQAAEFTDDIGDAFGRALGDPRELLKNPLKVVTTFVNDLTDIFNKNFIEKPISDWAKKAIGAPLAKQAFGKDLMKQGGLDTQQMNIALGVASNNLDMLAQAALNASTNLNAARPPGGSPLPAGMGNAGVPGGDGLTFDFFSSDPVADAIAPAVETGLDPLATASNDAAMAMLQQIPILGQFGSGLMGVLAQLAGGAGGGGKAGGLLSFLKMGLSIAGAAAGGGGGMGFDFAGIAGGDTSSLLGGFSLDTGGIDPNILGLGGGIPGFAGGGFTGTGHDDQPKGIVHANEWVFDAEDTRQYRPIFEQISAGRAPSAIPMFQGEGGRGPRQSFNLGGIHVQGAKDDRSARRSGRQAYAEIQRRISRVTRSGLNR